MLASTGLEPIYNACTYGFTDLAAVTAPFAPENRLVARSTGASLFICGMLWLVVAITVLYGHIGFTDV